MGKGTHRACLARGLAVVLVLAGVLRGLSALAPKDGRRAALLRAATSDNSPAIKRRMNQELCSTYGAEREVQTHFARMLLAPGDTHAFVADLIVFGARHPETFLDPILDRLKKPDTPFWIEQDLLMTLARMGTGAQRAIPDLLVLQARPDLEERARTSEELCLLTLGHTNADGWGRLRLRLDRQDEFSWQLWLQIACMRAGRVAPRNFLDYCGEQIERNTANSPLAALVLCARGEVPPETLEALRRGFDSALRSRDYRERDKCVCYGWALATLDAERANDYHRRLCSDYYASDSRNGRTCAVYTLWSIAALGFDPPCLEALVDTADERTLKGIASLASMVGYPCAALAPKLLQRMRACEDAGLRLVLAHATILAGSVELFAELRALLAAREESRAVRDELERMMAAVECKGGGLGG